MAVAIERTEEQDRHVRRASALRSLRNVAAIVLGFACLAGAALGHDLAGYDPRLYGAVFGLGIGLAAWGHGDV